MAGTIAGNVSDFATGTGIEGVTVALYNADGTPFRQGSPLVPVTDDTDASGDWVTASVPDGTYYAFISDATGLYAPQWYYFQQSIGAAQAAAVGAITVAGGNVTGVDTLLVPQLGNPAPPGPLGEVAYGSAWPFDRLLFTNTYSDYLYSTELIATPTDYGKVEVRWTLPLGVWDEVSVVRSFTGPPIYREEGEEIARWSRDNPVFRVLDAGVTPGEFVYYSLFVRDLSGAPKWSRAGVCEAIATKNFGWFDRLWSWLPLHYHSMDSGLAPQNVLTNEAHLVTIGGTGGTFDLDLTIDGTLYSLAAVPFDATADDLKALIVAEGMSSNNIGVTSEVLGAYTAYTVELVGAFAGRSGPFGQLVIDGTNLTGPLASAYVDVIRYGGATAERKTGPLERFVRLFAFELDQIHTEYASLLFARDSGRLPASALPYLAETLGYTWEGGLGHTRMRAVLSRYIELLKTRGTPTGVEDFIYALTGWTAEIVWGDNYIPLSGVMADYTDGNEFWQAFSFADGDSNAFTEITHSAAQLSPDNSTGKSAGGYVALEWTDVTPGVGAPEAWSVPLLIPRDLPTPGATETIVMRFSVWVRREAANTGGTTASLEGNWVGVGPTGYEVLGNGGEFLYQSIDLANPGTTWTELKVFLALPPGGVAVAAVAHIYAVLLDEGDRFYFDNAMWSWGVWDWALADWAIEPPSTWEKGSLQHIYIYPDLYNLWSDPSFTYDATPLGVGATQDLTHGRDGNPAALLTTESFALGSAIHPDLSDPEDLADVMAMTTYWDGAAYVVDDPWKAAPGDTYTFSCYVYPLADLEVFPMLVFSTPADLGAAIVNETFTVANGDVHHGPITTLPANRWTRVTLTAVHGGSASDTAVGAEIVLLGAAGALAYVDDAMLTKTPKAVEYFDGDTYTPYDECSWVGVAGESFSRRYFHRTIRDDALTRALPDWTPMGSSYDLLYEEPPG